MQLTAMSCDHCGAPLSVPDGAHSVVCMYCGARLEVHRTGSDTNLAGLSREQKNGDGGSTSQKPIGDGGRLAGNLPQAPAGWQVVASFRLVHDWHEAARVLRGVGIVARMQDDPRDASYSALSVPAVNAETARRVLAQAG